MILAQFTRAANAIRTGAQFEAVRGELTTRVGERRFFFKELFQNPDGTVFANGHYAGEPARLISLKTETGFQLRHVMTGKNGFTTNRRYIGSGDLRPLQDYGATFG